MANGKEYRGYVIYSGDEAWPSLKEGETRSERIRYLPVFPYINKPAMLSDFGEMGEGAIIYHIFAPIGCVLLLLLVIRTTKGGKKKKREAKASRRPAQEPTTHGAPQSIEARSAKDMFCINCGTPVNPELTKPIQPGQPTAYAPTLGGTGLIGFSDRYNHPEILAAAQSNRKFAVGCMWILVFVPLISLPLAGLLMDDFPFGESIVIGVGIALVMLIFNLLMLRSSKKPIWDGVVVNKYSKEKYEHRDSSVTYTEFTVVIRTDAGKKKTISGRARDMYDYFSVGDRVRYHPMLLTYEKYDKSKDRIIYCNVCRAVNPIQNDRCKRCNNLLFK